MFALQPRHPSNKHHPSPTTHSAYQALIRSSCSPALSHHPYQSSIAATSRSRSRNGSRPPLSAPFLDRSVNGFEAEALELLAEELCFFEQVRTQACMC